MARSPAQTLNQAERAAQKRRSREADARALAAGRTSPERLRAENEVFAQLAPRARVDLAASRSLS